MAEKRRTRINKNATNNGGRPPKDLKDVNKDEVYTRIPQCPKELINSTAQDLWKTTAEILIHRKQLKPAHICLLINYCNSFAITIMSPSELMQHGFIHLKKDGCYSPTINTVYSTYFNSMTKAMQMMRLDPKTELYNALADATERKGTHELEVITDVYNEF